MKQAHLISVNVNDGSAVKKTWVPEMKDLARRFSTGVATEEEIASMPKDQALQIGRLAKGRVPEVLGMSTGPFVVAPAIKDFLEQHEPGVHRFLPIRITTAKPVDGTTEHGTHWLLMLPPLVDCLVFEETVFKKDIQGKDWPRVRQENTSYWGGGLPYGADAPCTLDGDELRGRHLWRVALASNACRGDYACSPEFWSFFMSHKMLGWRSVIICTVK